MIDIGPDWLQPLVAHPSGPRAEPIVLGGHVGPGDGDSDGSG